MLPRARLRQEEQGKKSHYGLNVGKASNRLASSDVHPIPMENAEAPICRLVFQSKFLQFMIVHGIMHLLPIWWLYSFCWLEFACWLMSRARPIMNGGTGSLIGTLGIIRSR